MLDFAGGTCGYLKKKISSEVSSRVAFKFLERNKDPKSFLAIFGNGQNLHEDPVKRKQESWCFLKSSWLKCEKETCWDLPAQPLREIFLHTNTDSRCCKKSGVLSCVDLADLADLPQKAGIQGSSNRLSQIVERNTVHHPSSIRNIIHHSSSSSFHIAGWFFHTPTSIRITRISDTSKWAA